MFRVVLRCENEASAALNGSGRAPAALTIDLIRKQNPESLNYPISDQYHAHCVTVPGACAGWCDLIARHGTLAMRDIFAPVLQLAEDGFPVMPLAARGWQAGTERQVTTALNGQELTIGGRAPRAGEILKNSGLA